MNSRERAVLLFLIAVLLAGVLVQSVRQAKLRHQLGRIELIAAPASHPPDTSPVPASPRDSTRPPSLTRVNLNTATLAELDLLPGIGPALAQRIIDHRTKHGRFQTTRDLLKVPGIGPKTYAAIADRVTVQ